MTYTGYYAFVLDRIRRGYMDPVALHRANRTFRRMVKNEAMAVAGFEVSPTQPRQGLYRISVINIDEANTFVTCVHRHLNGTVGGRFALELCDDVGRRGVTIVGRPVARQMNQITTVEILRCATDGSRNACSKLYGAVRRHVRHHYRKVEWIVTYTLPEEGGASLKAAGFTCVGVTKGGSWSREDRPRVDKHPIGWKWRWVCRV